MIGAHGTLHGRAPPVQGCSAPRLGGACGARADGGATRRDAVRIPALMVWSIRASFHDQTACSSMGLDGTCVTLQRDPMWRGVGRLHGGERRLALQTCGLDRFQALDSTESTFARQVRKFEPGFGLVARPAHPTGPPSEGVALQAVEKTSRRKLARAVATTIAKGLLSGSCVLFVEMTAERISRRVEVQGMPAYHKHDGTVATRGDQTQVRHHSGAQAARGAVRQSMPCPGLAHGPATLEISYGPCYATARRRRRYEQESV
jgi:hypothetical protein